MLSASPWVEGLAIFGGIITTAALVVGIVNRWIVQPMRRLDDERNEAAAKQVMAPIERQLAAIATTIDLVRAEVTYNGGKSLKDSVRRIEHRLDRLEGAFAEHDRTTERLDPSDT